STINAQVFFYNTSYIVDTDVSGEYTSELYYNNKKSIAKLSLIRYSYSEPFASYRRGGGGNMTIGKIEVYDKKGEKLKFTTFFNSISPKSSSEIKLNNITFWDVNDAGKLDKDNNQYHDIYFKHIGNGSMETNLLNCATCTPYTYVLVKKYNGVPLIFEPLLNKLVQQNGQANNGLLVLGSGGYNTTLVSKKYNLRSDTISCYIKGFEEKEQYPYE
ncbi:MAG: hypothetical protein KDE33_25020, partial [Bacteroidetes bacterium]|nr:hypothetical protein [Bacteroidota bacterium]